MTTYATTRRRAGLVALLLLGALGTAHAGDGERGKSLYGARCAFCHGASGKGDGPAGAALKPPPTNFTSASVWQQAGLETMRAVIADGKPKTAMVGFKGTLSATDIDDLIAYLQTLKPAH